MKVGTLIKIDDKLCTIISEDYIRNRPGTGLVTAIDAREVETGREFWFAVHYTSWKRVHELLDAPCVNVA